MGLAQKSRESDLIVRPEIDLESSWRVTSLNTIRFNMGLSYAKLTCGTARLSIRIAFCSLSRLATPPFDIYLGGIIFGSLFTDQFAILQNSESTNRRSATSPASIAFRTRPA